MTDRDRQILKGDEEREWCKSERRVSGGKERERKSGNDFGYFEYEKAGIKDAPTTWEEFEEDCQKIADQGEIPVIVGGSDAWQLMRYLSFSPWRVTGPEFIEGYQAGTDSFSDNESAKYAVNLLSDLGTKGYF